MGKTNKEGFFYKLDHKSESLFIKIPNRHARRITRGIAFLLALLIGGVLFIAVPVVVLIALLKSSIGRIILLVVAPLIAAWFLGCEDGSKPKKKQVKKKVSNK